MNLLEIYRYPVKSMLGERLQSVPVDDRGLTGDRLWAIRDGSGKFASGKNTRRFHRMDPAFTCTATLGVGADPRIALPDGASYGVVEPGASEALSALFGEPVQLVREGETVRPEFGVVQHYDAAPVSFVGTATLQAVAELLGEDEPVDPRRFRVNFVLETDEPYVEDSWVGRTIRFGEVEVRATQQIERCRTVDVQQGEVPKHGRILKTLGAERNLLLAMYGVPVVTGSISVGDSVWVD